jgi:hypothetical protein
MTNYPLPLQYSWNLTLIFRTCKQEKAKDHDAGVAKV